jgi:hypothetical protein
MLTYSNVTTLMGVTPASKNITTPVIISVNQTYQSLAIYWASSVLGMTDLSECEYTVGVRYSPIVTKK